MEGVLARPTLVLNRNWQAIHVRPVYKALTKVLVGTAKIVDPETYAQYDWSDWSRLRPESDNIVLQCVGGPIRVPEIITLTTYSKVPSRTVSFSRRNLYLRDGYVCQYCSKKLRSSEVTIDHILPKSRGGRTSWENCVVACITCNRKKADHILREVGMKLIKEPVKPQWRPGFNCKVKIPSWEKFVSAVFWNAELVD